jgi:hypothetical protein
MLYGIFTGTDPALDLRVSNATERNLLFPGFSGSALTGEIYRHVAAKSSRNRRATDGATGTYAHSNP